MIDSVIIKLLSIINIRTFIPSVITSYFIIISRFHFDNLYSFISFSFSLISFSFLIMFLFWLFTYLFDKFIRFIFPIIVIINNKSNRLFTKWVKHSPSESAPYQEYLEGIYLIYIDCFHYALPIYLWLAYLKTFPFFINISLSMIILFVGFCNLLSHYLSRHITMDFQGFWGSGDI